MAEGDAPPPTPSPTPEVWTSALPEPIRGNEAWKEVKDVGDLANRYLATRRPFAEQLPEKIRGEAAFKDIKTLDALADSYFNAQKMLGVPKDQLLRLPTSDKPEDWGPVWDKVNGRPARPEDYKLTVNEGETIEPEFQKSLSAKAHELGIGNKQLDGLHRWLRETAAAQIAKSQAGATAEVAANEAALKTEWGQAYDAKINDGVAVVEFLEIRYPGLKANLDASKLGNNPALARFMADYAVSLREDGKITGRASGSSSLQSPAEAMQSISALRQDANFMKAYTDRRNLGHAEAMAKMTALHQLAYPAAA